MNPNCYSNVFRSEDSSYSQRGNSPSSSSSAAKKLKCDSQQQQQQEEEEKDMISNLPDSLLHHIFSFLDIKHAIHTCVLSKRWRYFWVSIPTFNFMYEPIKRTKKQPFEKFTDFVDRVLMLRDSSNIHKFAITLRLAVHGEIIDRITDRITICLDTWILVAVLRNVEELSFDVFLYTRYWLPHCLFTCKSLTKLEIHNSGYGILDISSGFPDKISLPRLKTLYLRSVSFRDKCLSNRMIPSCPNLESLILHQCRLVGETLDICSLKLEELVFSHCWSSDIWFNINVPNLISFHYYNNYVGWPKLGYEKKDGYVLHLVHILKQLHNVEDLKLSAPQFLTGARDLLDSLTKFCNLRCLFLENACISKDFNWAVSSLLKLSPNLETFGLTTTCATDCIFDDCCWEAGFSTDLNCVMMNHLTVFELRDVKGRDCELKFIEVLLKNAKVLERLVIFFFRDVTVLTVIDFTLSPKDKESYISFKETVLALPRSSLSSTISFK